MNIKSSYEKLYQHWLKEFNQLEISVLDQDLFKEYNLILSEINSLDKNFKDSLTKAVFSTYHENFTYLFHDFMKMREIKIINTALAFREINFNNLNEAEKLFYQNLVSVLKGFEKVKKSSAFETTKDVESMSKAQEIKQEHLEPDQPEIKLTDLKSTFSESSILSDDADHKNMLIRFLKQCPALVGIDLHNYGPFEKEDIAFIPRKNADILILEKFAEEIELF